MTHFDRCAAGPVLLTPTQGASEPDLSSRMNRPDCVFKCIFSECEQMRPEQTRQCGCSFRTERAVGIQEESEESKKQALTLQKRNITTSHTGLTGWFTTLQTAIRPRADPTRLSVSSRSKNQVSKGEASSAVLLSHRLRRP